MDQNNQFQQNQQPNGAQNPYQQPQYQQNPQYQQPPYQQNQYQQPPYQQPYPPQYQPPFQPPKPPKHGFAVAALVLGILGLICCSPLFGILGLVFSLVAKKDGNTEKINNAALIISIVGLVLSVLILIVGFASGMVDYYINFYPYY